MKNKKLKNPPNLIGISGKIGVGKDLVGEIIKYLIDYYSKDLNLSFKDWKKFKIDNKDWQIKKFADKLKDIVCILIGCTREQLEDHDFKNKELGKEWWIKKITYIDGEKKEIINPTSYQELDIKSKYPISYNIVIDKLTPRKLLQLLGTDCGRDIIHPNIWINALMSKYQLISTNNQFPKWIITDCRFKNEAQAIKSRNGILIRVNRDSKLEFKYSDKIVKKRLKENGYTIDDSWVEIAINEGYSYSESLKLWKHNEDIIEKHLSETDLDDFEFDYVVDNNSDLYSLIEKVKIILINEKIIKDISN